MLASVATLTWMGKGGIAKCQTTLCSNVCILKSGPRSEIGEMRWTESRLNVNFNPKYMIPFDQKLRSSVV